MDKQGIIDYVLDTPTNTNPRILGHMLDEYGANGGGGTSPFKAVTVEVANTFGTVEMFGAIYNSENGEIASSLNLTTETVSYTLVIANSGIVKFAKGFMAEGNVEIEFDGEAEAVTTSGNGGTYKITGPCSFNVKQAMA